MCDNVGDDCPACGGKGEFEITTCPLEIIPSDIWETIALAGMAEKGAWPELAGTLDQSVSFTEAMSFINRENNRWDNG